MARRYQRNRQNGRGAPSRRNRDSNISPVKFHAVAVTTLSGVTGTSTQSVNPQNNGMFGALAEVADQFDLWKLIDLEYRIHPMDPTNGTFQAVCYYPDVDIQTQTAAQAAQSPIAAVQTPYSGVPSSWMRVPRSQLKGMLDWYKCTPDAGAAEFELQGIVQIVGGLSEVCTYEFRGIVLFKNPVSSSLMAERAIDRAVKSGLVFRVPPPAPANPVTNGFVVLPHSVGKKALN